MKAHKQWRGFILTTPHEYMMGVFPDETVNARLGETVSKKLFSIYRGVALYFI